MKKLILLALAVGAGVLAKNKSQQLKAGAQKVAHDPRVQSALATAQDKVGGATQSTRETDWGTEPAKPDTTDRADGVVDDVADEGEVSATAPDPLTDPLPDYKS